jgi:hypothetical protein
MSTEPPAVILTTEGRKNPSDAYQPTSLEFFPFTPFWVRMTIDI